MTTTNAFSKAAYWSAFQEWVCAVCLDRRDDGECGLPASRTCALKRYLPEIVEVAHRTHSNDITPYLEAIETDICSTCPDRARRGTCYTREHAACALYSYLPLVLEAIDEVDGRSSDALAAD